MNLLLQASPHSPISARQQSPTAAANIKAAITLAKAALPAAYVGRTFDITASSASFGIAGVVNLPSWAPATPGSTLADPSKPAKKAATPLSTPITPSPPSKKPATPPNTPLTLFELAPTPSRAPTSPGGASHHPCKTSTIARDAQSSLQDVPCTPAGSLGVSSINGGVVEKIHQDYSKSSAVAPASESSLTNESDTAAAEATTAAASASIGGHITLSLSHKGQETTGHFPSGTTLGEALLQWAQLRSVDAKAVLLTHASGEEYLSDDHWCLPLGEVRLVHQNTLLLDVTVNSHDLVSFVNLGVTFVDSYLSFTAQVNKGVASSHIEVLRASSKFFSWLSVLHLILNDILCTCCVWQQYTLASCSCHQHMLPVMQVRWESPNSLYGHAIQHLFQRSSSSSYPFDNLLADL